MVDIMMETSFGTNEALFQIGDIADMFAEVERFNLSVKEIQISIHLFKEMGIRLSRELFGAKLTLTPEISDIIFLVCSDSTIHIKHPDERRRIAMIKEILDL